MPSPKRTSRVRFIWPVFKLGGAYFRTKDPWVSVDLHLPLHAFGRGCVREFEWYFDGTSAVPARDVPGVCEWLMGCEYVGDEQLFHYDDFWQHPCTFEKLRRGDCEDHALWAWRKLCEMGIRTEFVCGRLAGGPSGQSGHAWIVFHDAAGSYILDPVIKDVALMVQPLDTVKTNYIPHASVDQQYNRKMYGGLLHRVLELGQERQLAYSELRAERILETITKLERRIAERFAMSGLYRVSAELGRLASEAGGKVERLRRPIWVLRIGAGLGILGIVAIVFGVAALALPRSPGVASLTELLQGSEAAVNEVILLSMAIYFMLSIETRAKRRAALKALHRLRSVVHIVDMHQLTKDPGYLSSPEMATPSSPERSLTRFELARYLDYCSELFSLTSKVAALYAQHLNDAVVLEAVSDIETLAASLSNKVWQKIMILDNPRAESTV